MLSRTLTVAFDADDPTRLARFWANLLGREVVEDARGALVPGTDTQVALRFVPAGPDEGGPHRRLHLHVTSDVSGDQQQVVAAALRLGAGHLDVGQRPDEGHVVLADPEGNAFCVIEPENNFLAGCGPLGEVACDGTRQVGLFWSAVLDWPLVWDQDEETAVQSPHGGTKAAWGGPPVAAKEVRNPQRFELAPPDGDQRAEVDRLVSLGATRLGAAADGAVVLADPDGNEFIVLGG
ncbi:VOC family protein [Micromonospora siamensis]|uniref:Glyoxalase-like domain-containing protein n=1 Tax=Micromonospora siamensis TaxID=299152 RepID=A0A1C5K3K1_9ACTN|nr:VOC family protein [Micromonospora siamensis]SCG77373.1 Glyoxalase-like domain-containing protein [Micromonospora siamensis]